MIVNRTEIETRAIAANARWADALAHSWDRLGQVLRGQRDPLSPDVEERLERGAKKVVYLAVKSQKALDVIIQRGLFVVTEEGGRQSSYTAVAPEVVAKLLARAGLTSVLSPTFIALPGAQMSVTHAGLTASSDLAAHFWLFPEPTQLRICLRWSRQPTPHIDVQALPVVPELHREGVTSAGPL